MAAKKTIEAAVNYFASRSHDAWREKLHDTNPAERDLPRMRERGGKMVDINKPWSELDPKAKAENRIAAHAAATAIEKYPDDREKAAAYVHKQWIKRNKGDPNQPKDLFEPYAVLPDVEKDKDRAHIDRMKAAFDAVKKARKTKKKSKQVAPKKPKAEKAPALTLDAASSARLEAAAAALSKALGRTISAEALLAAGVEAVLAACETSAPKRKRKKKR
ncbi:MAG: hypothetical protein WAU68_08475 [Vitreimonas sp.]